MLQFMPLHALDKMLNKLGHFVNIDNFCFVQKCLSLASTQCDQFIYGFFDRTLSMCTPCSYFQCLQDFKSFTR